MCHKLRKSIKKTIPKVKVKVMDIFSVGQKEVAEENMSPCKTV